MNKSRTYYFLIIQLVITSMTLSAFDEVPMLQTKLYYSHGAYWPYIGCFDARDQAVDAFAEYIKGTSNLCEVIEESTSGFSEPITRAKLISRTGFSAACKSWLDVGLALEDIEGDFNLQHWSYDASYFTYVGRRSEDAQCNLTITKNINSFIQASWSYCPTGSVFEYLEGRYLCVEKYYLLPNEVINSGEQDLGSCPKGSGLVGNPINPATGNKTHKETIDFSHGPAALSMDLFYNSMGETDRGMGYGWSHSFSQSLSAIDSNAEPIFATSTLIGFYDPDAACTSGWNQIKSDYPADWMSTSSARMMDDGRCQIRYGVESEYIWGVFFIRKGTTGEDYTATTINANENIQLVRPDGKQVLFYQQGDTWLNDSGFSGRLSKILDNQGALLAWVLLLSNDTREYYDTNGRLSLIIDVKGNVQNLSYAADGLLFKVENNLGHSINFSYDSNQKLIGMNDNLSRSWALSYDALGNLQNFTYPDATRQQYHYENSTFMHALTGITDRLDVRYAWYEYDVIGRATSSYHALNAARIDIEYLANGLRYITDATGYRDTYRVEKRQGIFVSSQFGGESCQSCDQGIKYYEYDEDNNISSIRDGDGVVLRRGGFDAKGNLGYQIEAADSVQARRTDYEYDNRFFSRVKKLSKPSVYTEDLSARRVLHYVYDDYANPLSTRIEGFTSQGDVVQRVYNAQYDGPLHQVSQRDGARIDIADIRYFEYYPDDETAAYDRARLRRVIGEDGLLLTDNMHYTASGRLASERRANGLYLQYDYSVNDRLERLTEKVDGIERQTRWVYLATGELSAIEYAYGSAVQSGVYFSYDAARRLISVRNNKGDRIDYNLDAKGNRLSLQVYDDIGRLWKQITYSYNQMNKVLLRTQENEMETFSYDANGLLDIEQDGLNMKQDYSYDFLRQLIGQTTTLNDASEYSVFSYDYDVAGRRIVAESARHIITRRDYDDLGNLLVEMSPDAGEHRWQYDAAGNRITATDIKGDLIRYQYDAKNRLIQIDAPDTDEDVVYIYDDCDYGQGRLCRVVQDGQSLFYHYDAWGRISQYQNATYRYDRADRLLDVVYPSGLKVFYQYDESGAVSSVAMDRGAGQEWIATNIKHIPYGDVKQIDYANGLQMQRNYDQAYRVTSDQLSSTYSDEYRFYDANGHLLTLLDQQQSNVNEYRYDAMQRVISVQLTDRQRHYNYDESGNLLTIDDGVENALQTFNYALSNNHLLDINATIINYDDYGHQLNNERYVFTYNVRGRLSEIHEAGNLVVSYRYNGLGQRIKKILANGDGYQYFYNPAGHLLAEADLFGRVLREYIYIGDRLLAQFQVDSDKNGLDDVNETGVFDFADNDHDDVMNNDEWFATGTDANRADSDGDGFNDGLELAQGTNPLSGTQYPGDGDMNGNAGIDAGDYLLLIAILLGDKVPDESDYRHADINMDGVIDIIDLLLLSSRLLNFSEVNNILSKSLLWLMPAPVYAVDNLYGSIYFVHTNHLGAPVMLTDEQANLVVKMTYWPFGEAEVKTLVDVAPVMNMRFPGQYYDAESGLHYNNYRYYDPRTGRYLSADPLMDENSANPYIYVSSNPLNYVDTMGLDKTIWFGDGRGFFAGPRNGNWGGKNWSGGWNPQKNDDRTGGLLPVDSADECYMLHDLCWESCDNSCAVGECNSICDQSIVKCLQGLADDPLQWPEPPRQGTEWDSASYKRWAIWFFK